MISIHIVEEQTGSLAFLGEAMQKRAQEALDQSAASILNALRTTYLAEQDPEGVSWVRSQAAITRQLKGRGGGTLFDTGRLFHSIQLYKTELNERRISTDVPYGVYHNEGLGKQLKRTFLALTPGHVDTAFKIFEYKLSQAFA